MRLSVSAFLAFLVVLGCQTDQQPQIATVHYKVPPGWNLSVTKTGDMVIVGRVTPELIDLPVGETWTVGLTKEGCQPWSKEIEVDEETDGMKLEPKLDGLCP